MKKKLQFWLYRKNLENYLRQTEVSKISFWLVKKGLWIIEKELLFTDMIQKSTKMETQEIIDITYQKKNKGAAFQEYETLFNQLRFSCDEAWVIKGIIYRIESVEHIFDVELCDLESKEKIHISQLFPLSLKDFRYKCNFSITYPIQKFIRWQNESIDRDYKKIESLFKTYFKYS